MKYECIFSYSCIKVKCFAFGLDGCRRFLLGKEVAHGKKKYKENENKKSMQVCVCNELHDMSTCVPSWQVYVIKGMDGWHK